MSDTPTTTEPVTLSQEEAAKAAARAALEALACQVAAGKVPADPNSPAIRARGGHKDLNAKGNGPHWYRMVWRGQTWSYFAEERLPSGTFRASDRRATTYGDVFPGEVMCEHNRGGAVDAAYLVVGGDDHPLTTLEFRKIRSGELVFTLPDGSEVKTPNPRSKS